MPNFAYCNIYIRQEMGKGKLAKFADMERYENVFQYPFSVADNVPFDMKGHWRETYLDRKSVV